jgi:hypothetical protein
MQERYNKRMKWNSVKLEDAIVSQRFKHDVISQTGGVFIYRAGMESHTQCISETGH